MAHDVFISYASQDKNSAEVLCGALESQHIRCWIAPRDVLPGRGYGAQILQAIEASKLLVLVFSGHANASQHVTREIERAVNKSVMILPFRIENVAPSADLEYFISTTQWLDAIEPPLEQYLDLLANAVRRNLGQPVAAVLPEAGNDALEHRSKEEAEKRNSAAAAQRTDPPSPNPNQEWGNTPASAVLMTNYWRPLLMIGIPLIFIVGLYGIFGGSNKPTPEPPVASAPEAPKPAEGKQIGAIEDSKRNGQGTFTFPNGDKYVGAFKDDKFNGKGTFTFADGTSYLGEFKDGKRDGQGTYTFPSGNKYVGAFKDDRFNGKGTFTFANGEKYVGEFRNDKRNGQGTFYRADGTVHSTGIWDNDVLVR